MLPLIWLALNLDRSIFSAPDMDTIGEECFLDTLENELFKAKYYSAQHKLVDVFLMF